jgi:hypothetical protein
MLAGGIPSASAATISLVPVSATGTYVINGSEIRVQAGETVTLEMFIANWAPAKLRLYQITVDPSGYTGGAAGSLSPLIIPNASAGAFIDSGRAEFVHFGVGNTTAVDTIALAYRYASFTNLPGDAPTDPGVGRYAGTLKLVLSADAEGTFTIGLDPDGAATFLNDDLGGTIAISSFVPAYITVLGSGICGFSEGSNCHVMDPNSYRTGSDRRQGVYSADDFEATGTPIAQMCWRGQYIDFPNPLTDCGPGPGDDFRITIYNDGGGIPGSVRLSQNVTATKAFAGTVRKRAYEYTATLPIPVSVSLGTRYWVEITNNTPPGTCTWFWSGGVPGNNYSILSRDAEYRWSLSFLDRDRAFCMDSGIAPDDAGDVGGSCCICPATCLDGTSLMDCSTSGGKWTHGRTCAANPCQVPSNDACAAAVPISDGLTDFNNLCATGSGPDPVTGCDTGDVLFAGDLWFMHTPSATGYTTVSLCNDANLSAYDPVLAIYSNGTSSCVCPTDSSTLVVCNDDGCGVPFTAPPSTLTVPVVAGVCYLIRVGGYGAGERQQGAGTIEILPGVPILFVHAAAGGLNNGTSWGQCVSQSAGCPGRCRRGQRNLGRGGHVQARSGSGDNSRRPYGHFSTTKRRCSLRRLRRNRDSTQSTQSRAQPHHP